ncbi:MAG TPA: aminotransferase class I/II-fold pyridoxal phosphate-dependent enzyme, partial [Chloroflexota bacterium]|nr:aminotransferase class I/II-fold pyridoxal phosphate-dependent enzyme [Chloroflexota bacterium]
MTEPRISTRTADLPSSPIRGLTPLAQAAAAQGIRVYHINIGQPDLPAPVRVADAIQVPDNGVIPYSASRGMPACLEAWSDYYAQLGYELDPTDIVVTTGGAEAIDFALTATTDPGDEILVFDPTYASYLGYAIARNITLVPIRAEPPDYHLPDSATIERAITPRTRAIVIVNPNNPTGTVYTRDELGRIMEIAERHGLFVISDETYRELVFDGRKHVSAFDFPSMRHHVIVVDSASKRFS